RLDGPRPRPALDSVEVPSIGRHVEAADAGIAQILLTVLAKQGQEMLIVASPADEQRIACSVLDRRTPGANDAGAGSGGAAVVGAVDQCDFAALARQMIGGAGTQNAGTDHDDVHVLLSVTRVAPPMPVGRKTTRASPGGNNPCAPPTHFLGEQPCSLRTGSGSAESMSMDQINPSLLPCPRVARPGADRLSPVHSPARHGSTLLARQSMMLPLDKTGTEGAPMAGNLGFEELVADVKSGALDTVLVCMVDMQGRLI